MDHFCDGPVWNSSLLLNNTWPQFTDCFMNTILVWVPCGFLFMLLPYYVTSVRNSATGIRFPVSLVITARWSCYILLMAVSMAQVATKLKGTNVSTSPAAYLGDALYMTAYFIMCAMTQYERIKGVHTSSVPFFFWLLTSLCNVIPVYTMVIQRTYQTHTASFALLVVGHGLQLCCLALCCLVNNPVPDHSCSAVDTSDLLPFNALGPCPLDTCSFPSFLTFCWMSKVMAVGYRRDLEDTDLWWLPLAEQSAPLTSSFFRRWRPNIYFGQQIPRNEESAAENESPGSVERDPLLGEEKMADTSESTGNGETQGTPSRPTVGVLRTLLRMMSRDFWFILLVKVTSDIVYLLTPAIMGQLMVYLDNRPAERQWQGYVLCVAMFLCLITKSLLLSHAMFHAARLGTRLKSILTAAIYRKALMMGPTAKQRATDGEMVNLMSVDAQRVQEVVIVCFYASSSPLVFVVAVAMLYFIIGPAIFVGVLLLLSYIPLNAYVVNRQRFLQTSNLCFKDSRIRLVREILNGIKALKLYAWEPTFRQKVRDVRQMEVDLLLKTGVLSTLMSLCWEMAPYLVTLVTLATYVLSDPNNTLDAYKVFVSLSLFNLLRQPLALLSKMIMYIIMVKVSIKRIQDFLVSDDLDPDAVGLSPSTGPVIAVEHGDFTWEHQTAPVLRDIELEVKEGQLVAVVGPVGCGKSSFINAILGEMEKVKGKVVTRGHVAYVPQQSWMQNATVRDNILFGQPYIRSKYNKVVNACELERDLAILSNGDMEEIAEKGINLSGGQKQRVSVARAVYSESDLYLLDDPLSAVDSHVGRAIFNKVIGPKGILHKKTRVLVTHGVHWLPMVDQIIVMNDGKISERGSYEELMSHDGPFAQFLKTYLTEVFEVEEQEDPEIAKIHGRMRERLGSVTSCASSEEDGRRQASRTRGEGSHSAQHAGELFRQTSRPGSSVCDVSTSIVLSPASEADTDIDTGCRPILTSVEAPAKGNVSIGVYMCFARAVGLLAILVAVLSFCVYQGLSVGANYWLKEWTKHYTRFNGNPDHNLTHQTVLLDCACYPTNTTIATTTTTTTLQRGAGPEDSSGSDADGDSTSFYLSVYGLMGFGQVLFLTAFNLLYWRRMARCARVLHARLVDSVMRAPMTFFDTTPSGRILNIFSSDVETVDITLPVILRDVVVTFALVLVTLVVMVVQTPFSLVVLLPVAVLYYLCQRFYVPTARQLKRMECASRSPVYQLFGECLQGAASIRAYGATARFIKLSTIRVDNNQVFFFAYQAASRWMQWNLDALSAVLVAAACVFTITDTTTTAADAGLCISYALQVCGALTWLTRQISELQSSMVSVERLKEYSQLDKEAEWVLPDHRPPDLWPQKGDVRFLNYQARYRPDLDLALKGVTFSIKHGEKVGIVGRTGAGKSSLTLSLFRLIEAAAGCILIDGVNIADMGLHDLRSRLTILPQDPVVFSGSLRMNLDPFDQYTDQQLWTALDRAHLRQSVLALPGQLSFFCAEDGSNLSVGQRQLLCLARTLLRETRVLVLDEATAAVDMETDALIQNTIRSAFHNCTIITIAHRLNTIMDYDKILVMEEGMVAEFAPPMALLNNPTSLFFSLAHHASLV